MRILIVEDDPSLASGLARILEAEGYAVDVAGRGEEAVGAARGERFDLVILDIGLPGMDGFEVLRRLRGAARLPRRGPARARGAGVGRAGGAARQGGEDRLEGEHHPGGRRLG